jgi:hypothetical protein
MPVKVRDIVNAVINELSQVPGVATQLYSANRIQQYVQDAFLMEFDDFWWPQYTTFAQSGLDGVTGSLTQDLVGPLGPISDFTDIKNIWPLNIQRKLRQLPQSVNPYTLTGTNYPMYVTPDYSVPNRPFVVFPQESTTPLVVQGKQRPAMPLSLDNVIYLDMLMLQYDAAWMYCVDDGTIPAQVNKFQTLAQKRRTMIQSSVSEQPIPLDPRRMSNLDDEPGYFILDQDPLA